jgi:dCMP deaminase
MNNRISFIEAAIETARIWSSRSEDPYKKVGVCILNKDGRVLSVGYNGLLPKFNINEDFFNDRDNRRKYMIHAEINALSLVKRGDEPHLLASTLLPCSNCATNIVAYGVKSVVYSEEYEKDSTAKDIFKFYNIELIKI